MVVGTLTCVQLFTNHVFESIIESAHTHIEIIRFWMNYSLFYFPYFLLWRFSLFALSFSGDFLKILFFCWPSLIIEVHLLYFFLISNCLMIDSNPTIKVSCVASSLLSNNLLLQFDLPSFVFLLSVSQTLTSVIS